MADSEYRLLQLTNSSIGPISTATLLPVGVMTRQIVQASSCVPTFNITTNVNNSVYINEPGFYKVMYVSSVVAGAAGNVTVNLQLNGTTVYSASVTATSGSTVQIVIPFTIRILENCCANVRNLPGLIQLVNAGVAITGGTSNLIIERTSDI
jgi:PKD repeat protein